jgi:protein-arginine kinase activator protein McsA
MKELTKRKVKIESKSVACPVCGRIHVADVQFGPFCCASCLQTVIRPLIVTITIQH